MTTPVPTLTIILTVAMYLYPVVVIAADLALWLGGKRTITAEVTSSVKLRVVTCAYLTLWCVGLILHFGFLMFGG